MAFSDINSSGVASRTIQLNNTANRAQQDQVLFIMNKSNSPFQTSIDTIGSGLTLPVVYGKNRWIGHDNTYTNAAGTGQIADITDFIIPPGEFVQFNIRNTALGATPGAATTKQFTVRVQSKGHTEVGRRGGDQGRLVVVAEQDGANFTISAV